MIAASAFSALPHTLAVAMERMGFESWRDLAGFREQELVSELTASEAGSGGTVLPEDCMSALISMHALAHQAMGLTIQRHALAFVTPQLLSLV